MYVLFDDQACQQHGDIIGSPRSVRRLDQTAALHMLVLTRGHNRFDAFVRYIGRQAIRA
jgi:hypothetical protein